MDAEEGIRSRQRENQREKGLAASADEPGAKRALVGIDPVFALAHQGDERPEQISSDGEEAEAEAEPVPELEIAVEDGPCGGERKETQQQQQSKREAPSEERLSRELLRVTGSDAPYGQPGLSLVVWYKDVELARELVLYDAAVNPFDDRGRTALSIAALSGDLERLRALIERGADIEARDDDRRPPLSSAANTGRVDVVRELLNRGADIESKDNDGWAPLGYAAWRCELEVAQELVARGAPLEAKEKFGRTALAAAAQYGDARIMLELIKHGAEIETKDKDGKTPLIFAARYGHVVAIQVLIRCGATIEARDDDGMTALLYAARRYHSDALQCLVDYGAEIEAKSKSGWTALWFTLTSGRLDFVQQLIGFGADIDATNDEGKTLLVYAVAWFHPEVFTETIRLGANLDAVDERGRTALSYAAENGHTLMLRELIQRRAGVDAKDNLGWTALWYAADHSRLEVIEELVSAGATIDSKDNEGSTALMFAVKRERADVVRALVRLGADIEATDCDGRTPLLSAATRNLFAVVQELVQLGANVEARFEDGKSVLVSAAERGEMELLLIMVNHGADIEASDTQRRTAVSYAAENGHLRVLQELMQHGADIEVSTEDGRTPLSFAAARGHTQIVERLLASGGLVNAATKDGRTPLFYAAELGHTGVVRQLIARGASATAKSRRSPSRRESETPLTLSGRAGHMNSFQVLVEAGAPVNVRSGVDGETPLLSVARWDFFPGVQLLVTHGGCLDFASSEVSDDEYPLILGSLETMKTLCRSAFEFEPMCARLLERLLGICEELRHAAATHADEEGTLVSIASVVFRFCRLLFDIGKRRRPLSRFIGSRALANKIQELHEELDHFRSLLSLEVNMQWKHHWDGSLLARLEEQLSSDEALAEGLETRAEKLETAMLLQYELKLYSRQRRLEQQDGLERVLTRCLRVLDVPAPVVPEWFVSRSDVEFYSWNASRTNKSYEGKWRKTSVMIETRQPGFKIESSSVSTWYEQNHPNLIELFGACHIGPSQFIVYELVPRGNQLNEFLSDETNRSSMWKCLYQASLGLQHLHNRGVAHGSLRGENIIVGAGLVTKLCGIGGSIYKHHSESRDALNWIAPELARGMKSGRIPSSASAPADIYAFGMCIWEALTSELPWKGEIYWRVSRKLQKGLLPKRPASVGDSEWDLITKMVAADPADRAHVAYVVNRLKQFVWDSEVISEGVRATSQVPRSTNIVEEPFGELDGKTIPSALHSIQARCARSPDCAWISSKICPAFEHILALLHERHKMPADVEVVEFCALLSRIERYVRTAVSEKSVYQLARSRRVAESHHLVYAELDRLLDTLTVSESDPIRSWKRERSTGIDAHDTSGLVGDDANSSDSSTGAVSLEYFPSRSSASHQQWTKEGLSALDTVHLPWFLPLRELLFNESDKVGEGSFGTIYKGSWLDTTVVIKFMGYEEDVNTISTDLLLHEVRVWHRLNHPHVLKLYGACHVDKRYFVCEFAANGELPAFLKTASNERLKWEKMYEAGLGLQYLHSENVAHNDLKCDNIMVGMDGRAKLIDFGLSALLNEAEAQIDVKKMGAVQWRSPEYLRGERPSLASDVYSFAMCIVEVVSGDVPWGRTVTSAAQIRFRQKRGHMPHFAAPPSEKQLDLIRLMAKYEPRERVKMAFVVDKLHEIAQEEASRSAPLAPAERSRSTD